MGSLAAAVGALEAGELRLLGQLRRHNCRYAPNRLHRRAIGLGRCVLQFRCGRIVLVRLLVLLRHRLTRGRR